MQNYYRGRQQESGGNHQKLQEKLSRFNL